MKNLNKYRLISILIFISGVGSAATYVLHVIIGGILDPSYSQIANSISTLTAVGAPNQEILSPFLSWYHPLYITFCILLVTLFWKKTNKQMTMGAMFLTISSLVSKFGFGAFAFDGESAGMTDNNVMHIVVVMIVVIFSIAALFSIAIGCLKTSKHHRFGIYLVVLAFIFTLAGGLSAPLTANGSPIMGLVEKINIGTLQVFVCSVASYFLKYQFTAEELAASNSERFVKQ